MTAMWAFNWKIVVFRRLCVVVALNCGIIASVSFSSWYKPNRKFATDKLDINSVFALSIGHAHTHKSFEFSDDLIRFSSILLKEEKLGGISYQFNLIPRRFLSFVMPGTGGGQQARHLFFVRDEAAREDGSAFPLESPQICLRHPYSNRLPLLGSDFWKILRKGGLGQTWMM